MTNAHIIEAECGNCGEHYNPESLEKGWVEHYECGEELGKPRQMWLYYTDGKVKRLVPGGKKFKIKWAEVAAMVLACAFAVWAAWVIFG